MLKEVESLFSTSLWGFDSEAGIFYFVMEGGFMIGSYDQTEMSHYFILILVVSPLIQSREELSFLLRHLLQRNSLLIISTDATCKFILMSCDR